MIIKYFSEDVLEALEVPVRDVQPMIDLVKQHGYEDSDGAQYKFARAQVEYGNNVFIYLNTEEE